MRPVLIAAILVALVLPGHAAPAPVTVRDRGVRTLCAEEDNVYVTAEGPGVRGFEAVARHPAYAPALKGDRDAADFTGCKISSAKDYRFKPRTAVLYEDAKVRVKGVTYPGYWRPEEVLVDVAGRKDQGFHLIQLFVKEGTVWHEVLVLHAADGYWRLRPLPLPQFKGAVYGSSFLIGPIEETTRPFVRIREVEVDPKAMTLRAIFVKGGEASVRIVGLDHRQLTTRITFTPPVKAGGPFLAVRSMYVAADNADAAEMRWTDPAGARTVKPAVGFGVVKARSFSLARSIPSRHNTSAPDLVFLDFRDGKRQSR